MATDGGDGFAWRTVGLLEGIATTRRD
jgi:hypothetical protein